MSTEIIIALGTFVASVIGAILTSRVQAASLFDALCKNQQARIEQLHKDIEDNEQELDKLRCKLAEAQAQIDEIRGEKERLTLRVSELERENTELRAQIEALQKRRVTK